jgi:hypothetical protein
MDVLIPKTTNTGHLRIQDLFMELHCMIQKSMCDMQWAQTE